MQMDEGPDKRSNVDLMSRLPDQLLADILSLMPTVDAVKTSLLSKRWRHLWKYTHNIVLDELAGYTIAPVLADFVSAFRIGKARKFHVRLSYSSIRVNDPADSCAQFAFDRNVEDLSLDSIVVNWTEQEYLQVFPAKVFTISSLVELSLRDCCAIRLPFLKTLVLRSFVIFGLEVAGLFANCPSLESFDLASGCFLPEGSTSSAINHSNLKSLRLRMPSCPVSFKTPALEFLKFGCVFFNQASATDYPVIFEDVSSLFTCELDHHFLQNDPFHEPSELHVSALRKILEDLHDVKIIHLGMHFIQDLPDPTSANVPTIKWASLFLEIPFNSKKLKAVARILTFSSRIGNLTLNFKDDDGYDDRTLVELNVWSSLIESFSKLQQLKRIDIHGIMNPKSFSCSHQDIFWKVCDQKIVLMRLLLKDIMNLETLTIFIHEEIAYVAWCHENYIQLRDELNCSEKISSAASVDIAYD